MSRKKLILENTSSPEDNIAEVNTLNQEVNVEKEEQIIENSKETVAKKSDMEIHHPHTPHQGRKFKDYIFEFFMLFIAVTAGFFMENIREQRVERHKEKQYIQSMYKDIQEDTTNIQSILKLNKTQIIGIDSLLTMLEKPITPKKYKDLYILTLTYLNNYSDFRARNITMTQLKNSGGLRLIEHKSISDSIVFYYWEYEEHLAQLEFNIKSFQKIIDLEMEFLDWSIIKKGNGKLSIDSSFDRKKFANHITMLYFIIVSESEWLKNYKQKATSLLNFLNENYHLDN
jgi:hypothetical protein